MSKIGLTPLLNFRLIWKMLTHPLGSNSDFFVCPPPPYFGHCPQIFPFLNYDPSPKWGGVFSLLDIYIWKAFLILILYNVPNSVRTDLCNITPPQCNWNLFPAPSRSQIILSAWSTIKAINSYTTSIYSEVEDSGGASMASQRLMTRMNLWPAVIQLRGELEQVWNIQG